MINLIEAFSGFSVNDLEAAKEFYTKTLGLEVADEKMGLRLKLPGGGTIFVYPKEDHAAASYTVLNFVVEDIDATVDELQNNGVTFENYGMPEMPQDEKGILRGIEKNMGPDIAWFKDPANNILSVLQDNAE